TQQTRRADEKQELHELNSRLDQLVDAVKQKKSQNDELQERISQFRNELLYSSGDGHRSRLDQDLQGAKVSLNSVSEVNTMSKIRASRSMYELDRLREKYDEEVRWQSRDHDKIRLLESQRTESLHELNYLKENCESKKKSLLDDSDRNERLREQLANLANGLDHEQESRIDLECQIQTLLEKKKFEQELHRVMRDELERLFANQSSNPMGFFTSELRDIKQKIREDFNKLNEFNSDSMRHEYELRYSKIVEEMEIKKKRAEEARLNAEIEEKTSFESLSAQIESNKEEMKNLKLQEFNLNKLLQELHDKLNELRAGHADTADRKQSEIDQLHEQINNLKADLSSMLSFSKSLDSEVAVYARLLNQRVNSFVTQTYTFENYENLVLKDEINESHRILEQNELKRKQQELEENNRRLKELEEQRRRQKELDQLQRLAHVVAWELIDFWLDFILIVKLVIVLRLIPAIFLIRVNWKMNMAIKNNYPFSEIT
ncbi:Intermediate filament B, partial [Brachionus plicatilis]